MAAPFVADACALVAFYIEIPPSFSAAGLAAMRSEVVVSPISIWELAHKSAAGKLAPLPALNGSFAAYLASEGFGVLPLTWDHTESAAGLPKIHKDPMDRMLIAQALAADLTLITNDAMFARYGVRTVW